MDNKYHHRPYLTTTRQEAVKASAKRTAGCILDAFDGSSERALEYFYELLGSEFKNDPKAQFYKEVEQRLIDYASTDEQTPSRTSWLN